jgi:hypothetical protein
MSKLMEFAELHFFVVAHRITSALLIAADTAKSVASAIVGSHLYQANSLHNTTASQLTNI